MKFCRQPNGKFLKYSSVSDTIEEINIDEKQLLEEVIKEMAWTISDRYRQLLELPNGAYFDDVLSLKPASDNRKFSREKWIELFARCGASRVQLQEVEGSIDSYISDLKEELEDLLNEQTLDDEDEREKEMLERQINGLSRKEEKE